MTDAAKVVVVDRPGAERPLVVPLPWWQMIAARVLRTYLQGVLGLFVLAAAAPALTPVQLASGIWGALALALVGALPGAIVALLQNSAEVLSKLDQTNPGLRG